MQNRRKFLAGSFSALGWIRLSPLLNTLPAMAQGQTRAPQNQNQGSAAGQTLDLTVPPHPVNMILGRPTQRSITASILASQDGEGFVQYGTQPGSYTANTAVLSLPSGQPLELPISDLQPNTRYYYRLNYRASNSGPFETLEERSFHTQRSKGSPFTFVIQADSHLDSNTSLAVYQQTLANQLADQPDFMVDLGDTFMTDKYQPYTGAQKQYLAQRYFLGRLAPSPMYMVLGNHDGEGAPRAANDQMGVWAARMRTSHIPNPIPNEFYSGNNTPQPSVGILQNYYAWEWGDALIVVLDPYWYTPARKSGTFDGWEVTLGATQYQWLARTLAASQARWKIVFIHQLVGGLDRNGRGGVEVARYFEWGGQNADGIDQFAEKRPGWAMPIHQLLVKNRVNIVFHGHDHLFARQELDGIVYHEVPQPSSARFDSPNSAREYGYLTGDIMGSSGHLRVSVEATRLKVEYVRSYLAKDENNSRKNRSVGHTYTLVAG
jgi:predicted phosphodiesterase